jgi:hypothetical protein
VLGLAATVRFQRMPEAKTLKNRMYFDVLLKTSELAVLCAVLVGLGGSAVQQFKRFTVLANCEGNELCLLLG